jgi:ABC-type transport system involved in cytochrome c biogenesis ATPase subunit
LRLICGLLKPDAGTVQVLGADPFRATGVAAAGIGYVSQRFSLYGDLSIDENIEFFARIHGISDFATRRTRLLTLTGLLPFRTRLADRLSGGMKQKLALACTWSTSRPSWCSTNRPRAWIRCRGASSGNCCRVSRSGPDDSHGHAVSGRSGAVSPRGLAVERAAARAR